MKKNIINTVRTMLVQLLGEPPTEIDIPDIFQCENRISPQHFFHMYIDCSTKTAKCNEPLMAAPSNPAEYKNVHKKKIVENKIGRVLYWANLVDVQNIQIQGSGMLSLDDGSTVKLNFGGTNDMQFKSIGEQLRTRGIKPEGGYSAVLQGFFRG